ncbi:hypothetical protein GCM10009779_66870 [Polymorphospora rubra]
MFGGAGRFRPRHAGRRETEARFRLRPQGGVPGPAGQQGVRDGGGERGHQQVALEGRNEPEHPLEPAGAQVRRAADQFADRGRLEQALVFRQPDPPAHLPGQRRGAEPADDHGDQPGGPALSA